MSVSYEPEDIIVHLLRRRLSEPARRKLPNRQINTTYTASGNGTKTEFVVDNQPLCCVNSVTVGGSAQTEFVDYTVDLKNHKIIFVSAPAAASDNVVIDHDYGKNWIYSGDAQETLSAESYPRVAVQVISGGFEINKMGMSETDTFDGCVLQIDALAKKNVEVQVNGEWSEGSQVVKVLAREVAKVIKQYTNLDISQQLRNPVVLANNTVPFEEAYKRFRRHVDVRFEGVNIGES